MNAGDMFYCADTVREVMESSCVTADLVYGRCQLIYDHESSAIWKTGSPDGVLEGDGVQAPVPLCPDCDLQTASF
jgi:hypothetical protein